jgi:hypothetical protein
MVSSKRSLRRIVVIASCLTLCGCADLPRRPRPLAALARTKQAPEVALAPRPAPALYIPGTGAENTIRQTSGTVPPEQAQTISLPAPRTPGETQEIFQLPPLVPAAPPAEPLPKEPEPKENPLTRMRTLHRQAAERHAGMDSYIFRLRRREVVNGGKRPEEILLVKFRKDPWSVYFKWLSTEGKNREVVYVKGRYDNVIHTLTAAGDIPFLPPGRRFKVAPDSVLVKSKSRYPITESGFGPMIDRFSQLLDANERGDARLGTLKYLGQLKRPEFETKVEAVLHTVPPQSDPHLPKGGQRLWFFDTATHLPALVITHDETGREVEYYCHDRMQFPVALDDDDFNPDKLWGNR